MTKNNFRLLDMNKHLKEVREKQHNKKLIEACKTLRLTLNAVTFAENKQG